jgi:LPXTG-site transpeptidase (sortase) family protein
MGIGARFGGSKSLRSGQPGIQRTKLGRLLSRLLFLLGALFLLAAIGYALYSALNTWIMGQDRYLRGHDLAALSVPNMTWTPSPTPTATVSPTFTATPTPMATATPAPTPLPPPPPVQIRIPALDVSRSIIPLSRFRDPYTGAWTWDTESLFRYGRTDLVGHWDGSANPGQEGNMILVGHNYGYGYNGVFVRLGSLQAGQRVYVVNEVGETFTYQVTTMNRVAWWSQSFGELTQHLSFLAPGGSERVTLVSCSGADLEPFPERIYVEAEPVR